jgi:hypothetical protein
MPLITFRGHIDLGGHALTFGTLQQITVTETPFGVSLSIQVEIKESKIKADCVYPAPFDNHAHKIYFYCLSAVQAIVNLTAFERGFGAIVVIDSSEENGIKTPVALGDPDCKYLCTAFKMGNGYDKVLSHVLSEAGFMLALNDLIQAVSNSSVTPINCARVIDAVRHLVSGNDIEPRKAWPRMHKALNIDESYLTYISDASKKHRHGNPVDLPDEIRGEVVRRSWQVMNRFMHYRLRGNKALPLTEFPTLRG